MQTKCILVTSAAGLFTASTAFAADLPKEPMIAEPIEYVKSCDAYGNGYFNLPGTETCLNISGRIRAQVRTGNLSEDEGDDWDSYTRGYGWFETETATSFGSIYTYTGFSYTYNQTGEDPSWASDDAFITFKTDYADLNFGVKLSEFYGFLGYSWMQIGGANWVEYYPLQASVNIPVDNFTLSLAVEDASYMDGSDQGLNFVGALDYSHDLVSFRLAAAAHENTNEEYGYALSAYTEIKPIDKLALSLGAQYAVDASKFVGLSAGGYGDLLNGSYGDDADEDQKAPDATYFDTLGVSAFSVMGGMKYALADDVDVMFEASYLQFETDNATTNFDGDALRLSGSVVFKPAPGLGIALAAGYSELTANGETSDTSLDVMEESTVEQMRIGTRIQYTF